MIIGTGGHIDHGKTALVRALTGADTDRLPEEKARGISIDLGFTRLPPEAGGAGVVDVPGHEDFIRNMLAGATGIDLLLLVVAADEGVMPQTREHAAIAELLGVERAVIALTKIDLVGSEWAALVRDDLAEFLAGTPYEAAPIVATSAVTGEGIDALRTAITEHAGGTRGSPDDLFRLPVDRAFTVRGTGTVVTGTVWSGRLEVDRRVRLLPGGDEGRVRGLQVHGADADVVAAGERAAIALAGVDVDRVGRGTVVVTDPGWAEATMLTTRLRMLPGRRGLEPWQRVRVHLGTAEAMARAVPLEGDEGLAAGAEGWVQLRLETELVARAGDRLVLRSFSPVTTIGGGLVVEPLAPKRTRLEPADVDHLTALASGRTDTTITSLLRDADGAGLSVERLPILSGATPPAVRSAAADAVRVGDRLYAPETVDRWAGRLRDAVEEYHRLNPLHPGMDVERLRRVGASAQPELVEHVIDRLEDEGALTVRHGRVARPGWQPTPTPREETLRERIAARIEEGGLAPPRVDGLAEELGRPAGLEDLLALLEDAGRVVRVEHDLFVHAPTLHGFAEEVRDRFGGRDDLSPADFRDIVELSRRHLMPLLSFLDREGVTVRGRDGRSVPGR